MANLLFLKTYHFLVSCPLLLETFTDWKFSKLEAQRCVMITGSIDIVLVKH